MVLDVKDQTEYFMEKGEIRKYIPFKIVQFRKCIFLQLNKRYL